MSCIIVCFTRSFVTFRLLGLDLVPRSDESYEQVDVDKESTIDLFNIHSQSAQNIEEASVSISQLFICDKATWCNFKLLVEKG